MHIFTHAIHMHLRPCKNRAMKISPFLYKRPTASGEYNIYIRISHRGEYIERSLGFQIQQNEWDDTKKRVKPKSRLAKQINTSIDNITLKANSIHMNHVIAGTPIVLDEILPRSGSYQNYVYIPGPTPKKRILKLSDIYTAYIEYLEAEEKYFTVDKMRSNKRKVIAYKDIPAKNMDADYLQGFKSHLRRLGNGDNTINYNIKAMRTAYNHAMVKGIIKENPMAGVKVKFTKPIKTKLNRNEIESLKVAEITPHMRMALCCWLLSWNMRGTRVKTMLELRWEHIQDGRIITKSTKTDKEQSIRITPEIQMILDSLPRTGGYIFPYLEGRDLSGPKIVNAIKNSTSIINSNLRRMRIKLGISKKLTMHTARHSFATIADKSGLSVRTIQQLLNHSSLQMTETYLSELRIEDEMDQAADVVYGNVDGRLN